jgi:hypothetical protein
LIPEVEVTEAAFLFEVLLTVKVMMEAEATVPASGTASRIGSAAVPAPDVSPVTSRNDVPEEARGRAVAGAIPASADRASAAAVATAISFLDI